MANTVKLTFAGDSKDLERAFDRVGDSADKMERKVKDSSSKVDNAFRGLGDDAAKGFGLSFSEKIGPLVAKAPLNPALAALAAAAVPAIAAAVTAGLLLAVGGGVLVAGIMAAAKDPKVASAFSGLADRARKAFSGFGEPFKAPLIRAADTFGDALERMAPAFMRMGQTMAPLIDILAPAFAQMAEKSLPGIEKAVKASVPLFEKLAEHAPAIGEAISKFFEKVAEGAPAAVTFFDKLLTVAEVVLPLLGDSLKVLTQAFNAQWAIWEHIFGSLTAAWNGLKTAVGTAKDFIVDKFNSLIGFFKGLQGRMSNAFSGLFDGVKNAFKSALNWVIDRWNNFSIPGIDTPFGTIGGFNTPNLPRFHSGGVVPGAPGQEMLAILQAGERVVPAGGGSGGMVVVEVYAAGGGTAAGRKLAELVLELLRGGDLKMRVLPNGRVVGA